MPLRVTRAAIPATAAFLVTACGGGGTFPYGSVVNSPGGGPTQPPTQLVDVHVVVTVPQRRQAPRLRPDYISVNTQSLVIELSSVNGNGVTGVNPTTINTIARAHGCQEQGKQLICSATASGSPGDDVFAVTTYAGTNATGAVLSVGPVSAEIGSNSRVQIDNKLSLALEGVIASLKLSLSPNGAKRGKAVNSAATLLAFDATGAQIVGPSRFTTPITLATEGDTDKAFTLHAAGKSGSSLTIVKPTSDITLSYDGNDRASSISVQASIDGPSGVASSANFTLYGKIPPPPVGTIYALNLGANDGLAATVTEYSGKAKGNASPERTLNLSSKLYARAIAVDASGDLYVGYLDNEYGFSTVNGTPDKGNEVAIYAPGASGNAAPTAVLTADKTTQTALFPIYMSFDPSGRLVTYGATSVDGNVGNDAVLTYAAGSSGPAAPAYGWGFTAPTLYYAGPTGLALDASGNFYVNGALHTTLGPDYGLFVATESDNGNPSVNPSRTIPWNAATELNPGYTTNVALNSGGEIYIGNTALVGKGSYPACQGRANVFAAGTTGGSTDVKPLRVLTLDGVYTANHDCLSPSNPLVPFFPSIALYGTILFVADDVNDAIDQFSANASGIVKPSIRIAGSATGLNAPVALVITAVSGQAKAGPDHPSF
jgi:hypothetical protein